MKVVFCGGMDMYKSLKKLYYTDESSYEAEYQARWQAPFTQHFSIEILQYNRKKAYPAFFYYTNEMVKLIEQIGKTYENFVYLVNSVPPVIKQQFALMSIVDEVKSTNDIEGVHSTRKEIEDILSGKTKSSKRLGSIVNKYRELLEKKEIHFDSCNDIRIFYDEFAHQEIIQENSAHKLDGQLFRKDPVDIESGTGKIIHRGVSPETQIIADMEQAVQILYAPELPVLVRLSIFHYLFAYIHPFYDGNGRTDRFITSYYLRNYYHQLIALRLSVYIKANRKMYYKLFEETDSEINRGDLTPFIIGFLQIIHGTINDTIRILKRKKEQLEKYQEKISEFSGEDKLLKSLYYILLQAAMFYGQGINMNELMHVTGKSRVTIQKRINEMPQDRLVITKSGKTMYYKLNLKIFASRKVEGTGYQEKL